MSLQTRSALTLIGVSLVLGVLGDALFRVTPLGINVVLWTIAVAAAAVVLARSHAASIPRWLLPLLVASAALFAWRDSEWLAALNGVAIVAVLAAAAVARGGVRLRAAGLTEIVFGAVVSLAAVAGGMFVVLFEEVRWAELAQEPRRRRLVDVGRGIAIALPVLLVFGGLLVAADAVFEDLLGGLAPDLGSVWTHVLLALALAWGAGGLLRGLLEDRDAPEPAPDERRPRLGSTEVAIVLATLDVLFLAFVLVQFRYFFGGNELVQERTGLTYAEYAREGFFELVAVAALALAVLLLADWVRRGGARAYRVLGALLIVLLFVIMASALQRMRLYQREFGLTELRVYTTAFMLWLAVVLIWLGVTVLRGRRERFAFGALVAGVTAIVVLNAVNPDALIARTNIERSESAKDVDISYLATLSGDAAPTIAEELAGLARRDPEGAKRYGIVARTLLDRWNTDDDWRTWSWGRSRAGAAVRAHGDELRELAALVR